MARKKTTQQSTVTVETDKYKVVKEFKADINGRQIQCKAGETVELNTFEYTILKRFLE